MKLMLVDHVHPMAPWFHQTEGTTITGEGSEDGVILLYRPSPRSIQQSLVYEWCNVLRTYRSEAAELFLLTEALEDFVDLETGKVVRDQWIAWNLLVPERNGTTERLIEFLGAQDLFRIF